MSNYVFHYLNKRFIIDSKTNCWNFTGFLCAKGYGICGSMKMYRFMGERRIHRIMYTLINGPIPKRINICHKCDNTKCFNPDHLFAGTQLDNMRDCKNKGRNAVIIGQNNPFAKLKNTEVIEIRQLRKLIPGKDVANAYGVSIYTVYSIWAGQSWSKI